MVKLPKISNLKVIMSKFQENKSTWRAFCKIPDRYPSKVSIHDRQEKMSQTTQGETRNCHRLKKIKETQQFSAEKRMMEEKLVKILLVCSFVSSTTPC